MYNSLFQSNTLTLSSINVCNNQNLCVLLIVVSVTRQRRLYKTQPQVVLSVDGLVLLSSDWRSFGYASQVVLFISGKIGVKSYRCLVWCGCLKGRVYFLPQSTWFEAITIFRLKEGEDLFHRMYLYNKSILIVFDSCYGVLYYV